MGKPISGCQRVVWAAWFGRLGRLFPSHRNSHVDIHSRQKPGRPTGPPSTEVRLV